MSQRCSFLAVPGMEAQTELPSATGKEAAVTNAKEEQTPSLLERER